MVFKCSYRQESKGLSSTRFGAVLRKMFAEIYRYEIFPYFGVGNLLLKFVLAF
jgi:hypothetical protein